MNSDVLPPRISQFDNEEKKIAVDMIKKNLDPDTRGYITPIEFSELMNELSDDKFYINKIDLKVQKTKYHR